MQCFILIIIQMWKKSTRNTINIEKFKELVEVDKEGLQQERFTIGTTTMAKKYWVSASAIFTYLWEFPKKEINWTEVREYRQTHSAQATMKEFNIGFARLIDNIGNIQKPVKEKPPAPKRVSYHVEERELNTVKWEYKAEEEYWKKDGFEVVRQGFRPIAFSL